MFGTIQFTNTCVRECSLDLVFRPLYATCRKSWNKCELKIMYYIYYRIFSVHSAEESYEYKFEIYMEYVRWADTRLVCSSAAEKCRHENIQKQKKFMNIKCNNKTLKNE